MHIINIYCANACSTSMHTVRVISCNVTQCKCDRECPASCLLCLAADFFLDGWVKTTLYFSSSSCQKMFCNVASSFKKWERGLWMRLDTFALRRVSCSCLLVLPPLPLPCPPWSRSGDVQSAEGEHPATFLINWFPFSYFDIPRWYPMDISFCENIQMWKTQQGFK